MNSQRLVWFGGLILTAMLLSALPFVYQGVRASQLSFKTDCHNLGTATSSLVFMTPGTATTTVTCGMGGDGAQSATLAVVVNASSSWTQVHLWAEESMDGQDWYPVSMNQIASTTAPFSGSAGDSIVIQFASSTIGGAALGTGGNSVSADGGADRNHYLFNIPVRMSRVRAYAGLATTTGATNDNAAIHLQIIPRITVN